MQTPITETRKLLEIDANEVSKNAATMLRFVRNIQDFVTERGAYADVIHPDAVFTEYPNLITRFGQVRTAEQSMAGLAKGKQILEKQEYQFLNILDAGNNIIAEILWIGVMAMDVAHLKKGQELKAHICMIVEFKDGKIYRQRNYDCYDPFSD